MRASLSVDSRTRFNGAPSAQHDNPRRTTRIQHYSIHGSKKEIEMRSLKFAFAATLLLGLTAFAQQHTLSSCTTINVRTDQAINAHGATTTQSSPATVTDDVMDSTGAVAIPKGSRATLVAVPTGN